MARPPALSWLAQNGGSLMLSVAQIIIRVTRKDAVFMPCAVSSLATCSSDLRDLGLFNYLTPPEELRGDTRTKFLRCTCDRHETQFDQLVSDLCQGNNL